MKFVDDDDDMCLGFSIL